MSRGHRKLDPPSGLTGSSRPNRLSRSFRRTQQTQTAAKVDSPKSQQSDFKTPTRIPRSRAGGGFSGESPHNDSDLQQDIIWDATSPSPSGHGKRGKKQRSAGAVDISEIVSRIAPKHGRPEAAEPTLQQWIGDSAAIPCTPDLQVPKPKKKSPRLNGVDDLLKLARRFDFNLFHQDEEEEEEAEEPNQQSLELLSQDIFDLDSDGQDECPAAGTDVRLQQDQHMQDDLDFLFDGPTQHIGVNLSQLWSQVKPASCTSSKEAPGKPSASTRVSTTNTDGTQTYDEFEDDWENDDLINDSLVLEMTQNPQRFSVPKHCSTQKPSSETRRESPGEVPVSGSAASHHVKQRTTFKLESNPNFSVGRIQTNSKVDNGSEMLDKDSQKDQLSSAEAVWVKAGCRSTWQPSDTMKSDPQFNQRTSEGSNAKYDAPASTAQSFSSRREPPAVPDLLDEDLDSFFSSDPVWDDPADDDLLCEVCEDLENQIQRAEQTLPEGHASNQKAALRPANQQPFLQTPAAPSCASGRAAGSSLAGGFVSNVAAGVQMNSASFRAAPAENTSGSTNGSERVWGRRLIHAAPRGSTSKDQFTFKKPNHPVSTGTRVVAKCSAAEIEMKKQQAMERRRLRLQAAQNLRAPT
uniref:ewing's tumor-associated antigen 1 n=1 Tax=Scatophagus argus TaxID=75038 RepID=UPI001ED841F9|nr:ewing's tumor-associated antigen 1 [Scatophagus argus]